MFPKSTLFFSLLLFPFFLTAQNTDPRLAPAQRPLAEVERIVMPAVDNEALLQEEMERRGPGVAPRFATSFEVDIRPSTHGTWEKVAGGKEVWRLRIHSATAHSLNLGFTEYYMPPGGSLILYSPSRKQIMGPFTKADNEAHQQFWTPVFDGDELVVEVQLPAERRSELQLRLTSVSHDFLGFNTVVSGSCNLDVICGEEDGWAIVDLYRDIIQSVAVYGFGGNTFCTGFLINNGRNDCTPYFMTAFHCGVNAGNAPTLVVYWNYENSFCRQPNTPPSGGPGDGALTDFNTGAEYRSGYAPSDFVLVELDDPVSETANAFFAGWNNSTALPSDTTICIHHPSTDEKRISFEFDPTYLGNWPGTTPNPNGNHIIVPDWDIGTTEGGSSGSPLFNKEKQVVGQLHGGSAACGNDLYDSYGWFRTSWNGGGTASSRLSDWLDPDGLGLTELDGHWQEACNFFVDALIPGLEVCAPDDAVYNLVVSANFENAVTVTIDSLPAGLTATLEANPVMPGDTIDLTISGTAGLVAGVYTIQISGTDSISSDQSELILEVATGPPDPVLLLNPADGADDISTFPVLSWDALPGMVIYELELSTDPGFADPEFVLFDLGVTEAAVATLEPTTTYYWRVRGDNICGTGEWSAVYSFTTSRCSGVFSNDVPVAIAGNVVNTVTSTLEITDLGLIDTIRVLDVNVSHTWIGDLQVFLTSPGGTIINLIDRPGVPASNFGCSGDNLLVTFDDTAPLTADDLEATCSPGVYALAGTYQPIDPLSGLQGEIAAGTWTLTVVDNFSGDGGAINGWGLEICTLDDISLTALTNGVDICTGESDSFVLAVGSAFNGPVTLTAEGLPAEATVSFSSNPVNPGETVTATVGNFLMAGLYPVTFNAVFDTDTAGTTVAVNVAPFPAVPELLLPADGATGVSFSTFLDWAVSGGADSYVLTVATDPELEDVIFNPTLGISNFTLAGLDPQTTYYWQVEAFNDCGGTVSAVHSFTTQADISVAVAPLSQTVCNTELPEYTLQISSGFAGPVTISYTVEPVTAIDIDFDMDPANVPPGSTVTATVGPLTGVGGGSYTLLFDVTDGNSLVTEDVQLVVQTQPAAPTLNSPAADAVLMTDLPSFSWNAVSGAVEYRLEIATDPQFNSVVRSVVMAETTHTLTDAIEPGDYFWRVTALNNCGGSTSGQRPFRVNTNSTGDLAGRTVSFEPNPTGGLFYVRLSAPLPGDIQAEVFSLNGQRLKQLHFAPSATVLNIDLSDQPSGLYVVRLRHEAATLVRRIVVE